MELERFKSEIVSVRQKLFLQAKIMLQQEEDAEDAVQETFLKLWNVRSQLENHPNTAGFAMQTLKHVCIDRMRTAKLHTDMSEIDRMSETVTPYTFTEQNDNLNLIRRIMEALPATQRQVIQLRDVEGYELEKIADIMGAQVSAVKMNLSRARKAVRDRYLIINNTRL